MATKKKQAKNVPNDDKNDDANTVPEGEEKGQASTVPELEFSLPGVSETSGEFVDDDEAPAEGFDATGEFHTTETSDPAEQHRGTPDAKGNPYDPAIHAYPPEQTGKLGKWKKKPKSQQSQSQPGEPQHNASYRRQAAQYAYLYAHGHVTLFGKDGTIDRDAIVPLVDALEQYFIENGNKDLPAGAAVALSAFNYSVTIASRPPNMEKLAKWFNGVVGYIKKLFGKNKKTPDENKQGGNDARSDSRQQ